MSDPEVCFTKPWTRDVSFFCSKFIRTFAEANGRRIPKFGTFSIECPAVRKCFFGGKWGVILKHELSYELSFLRHFLRKRWSEECRGVFFLTKEKIHLCPRDWTHSFDLCRFRWISKVNCQYLSWEIRDMRLRFSKGQWFKIFVLKKIMKIKVLSVLGSDFLHIPALRAPLTPENNQHGIFQPDAAFWS